MDDISHFESRTGNLTCTSKEVFDFVTDIRNFERFIPNATINDWQAGRESCSFSVSMVGTVSFRLIRKEAYNKVVFSGDALEKNNFSLILNIRDSIQNMTEVKVSLDSDLNPMLKMIAPKPIARFLEILINEMENFKEWGNIRL
jgi:carbon monoxide dehydrogenase subunit G